MTSTDKQQQLTQSIAQLKLSKQEPGMQVMQEVLKSLLDSTKDKLVLASGEAVPLLQGEGRAYRKLLKYITEGSLTGD